MINEESLNDIPERFLHDLPPSTPSSPSPSPPPAKVRNLRRTARTQKSYGGIIVGQPAAAAGVGKGGKKISMTRAMKTRKPK